MKNNDLTIEHMNDVLAHEITFGSAAKAKRNYVLSKSITYQPSTKLIRVYSGNERIAMSQNETEMIALYNSLSV